MAWNEPGKNGQNDPWTRKRPGGKSPLDELFNQFKNRLGKMGKGPGGILTAVLVLLVVGLLFSSYTIVGARQSGVVLRFGAYERTLPPGFHLKLPQPIESVTKVEATRIRSLTDKVSMLTKDENIITIAFTVQYQVDDSRKYLFSLNDPDGTIGSAAEAAVRSVIGSSTMDQILSAAGASLVSDAQTALQKTLDGYDSGLRVTEVSFQNVAPPDQVKDAFDDVNNAREDKQSIENAALAYASKVVPVARGDAARIAAEAAGYKAARIAQAEGETAAFNLVLAQYQAAPAVTRKRLWLETMEQVMAKNPKVVDDSSGRNIINLPALQAPAASANSSTTVGAIVPDTAPDASSDNTTKEAQP